MVREVAVMSQIEKRNILIAGWIGAIIGGVVVAIATDAIPRMIEAIFGTIMGGMMKRMGEEGCTPQEM